MPLVPVRATYRVSPRLAAKTRTHQYAIFPAPMRGLDFTTALPLQHPQAANRLDNFTIRRSGAELRPGYKRWVSNIPGTVVTIMVYNPPRGAGSALNPKIFAASDDGNIYDVTSAQNEAFVPPVALAVPGQIHPGRFSFTNFSTLATNFLCICSAGGGYFTYDQVGGWVPRDVFYNPPGGGAAVNVRLQVDFIMSWKNRLWFIADNTTDAYFLPTNSVGNTAGTAGGNFDFGPLFTRGGDLTSMASWTMADGGSSIDDRLVVVSRGGDVLVYEGTDPTSAATFRIVGRWFIGRPPNGRRFMSKYGGDLMMITAQGVEYVSRLLNGQSLLDPVENKADEPAFRYNEVIGTEVRQTYGQEFWHPVVVTSEQFVVIVTPFFAAGGGVQHIFSTLQRAWSRFTAIPMRCAETLDGELFFGTPADAGGKSTVCKLFGAATDDELSDLTPGRTVQGALQTSYIAPGNDLMALKIPQLVMPMFIAADVPKANVKINTEWDASAPPSVASYVPPIVAQWDIAKWDVAVWAGGLFTFVGWVGVSGLGVYMSLSLTLVGVPRTLFTSWKLVFDSGGIA